MDAKSIQETLEIFNFTKTYAVMMKLTTDIYILIRIIRSFIWQNLGV